MSAALVEMFNNQPMTNSMAIAEGTQNTHKQVIAMVRKYISDLQEFGSLAFETRVNGENEANSAFETRNSRGRYTEIALLNEQQATLLITYLKNTEVVRRFKIALVKAFYELRDQLTQKAPHTNNPLNLNHRADIRVAADRTFRSVMRACRAGGARLPQALQRANEVTIRETGINILEEYQLAVPTQTSSLNYHCENAIEFFKAWSGGQLPVPFVCCRSIDFYEAYKHWAIINNQEVLPINQVNACISRDFGLVNKGIRFSDYMVRVVQVPSVGFKPKHIIKEEVMNFATELAYWKNS